MRKRRTRGALALLAGVTLILPILAGCHEGTTQLSKDEQANFKGGPMPESARQIMQQKMREAQQAGGPKGAPSVPGVPGAPTPH